MIDAFIDFFSSDFAENNIVMLIGLALALIIISAFTTFFITKTIYSRKQHKTKDYQETISLLNNEKNIIQNRLIATEKECEKLRNIDKRRTILGDYDDYEKNNH